MQRAQVPEEVALDVEALLAVAAEKRPLARVGPLVYDHGGVRREHLLAGVAELLVIVDALGLGRRGVVHQGQLFLGVLGLDVPDPLLGRGVRVAAEVALEGREVLGVVVLRALWTRE